MSNLPKAKVTGTPWWRRLIAWTRTSPINYHEAFALRVGFLLGIGLLLAAFQPAPDIDADTGGFLKALYVAATTGKWKILAGLVMVGLVWVFRRVILGRVKWFQTKLGGIVLAVSIATLSTFGLAWSAGADVDPKLLLDAIGTALTAAGAWEWLKDAKNAKKPDAPS